MGSRDLKAAALSLGDLRSREWENGGTTVDTCVRQIQVYRHYTTFKYSNKIVIYYDSRSLKAEILVTQRRLIHQLSTESEFLRACNHNRAHSNAACWLEES